MMRRRRLGRDPTSRAHRIRIRRRRLPLRTPIPLRQHRIRRDTRMPERRWADTSHHHRNPIRHNPRQRHTAVRSTRPQCRTPAAIGRRLRPRTPRQPHTPRPPTPPLPRRRRRPPPWGRWDLSVPPVVKARIALTLRLTPRLTRIHRTPTPDRQARTSGPRPRRARTIPVPRATTRDPTLPRRAGPSPRVRRHPRRARRPARSRLVTHPARPPPTTLRPASDRSRHALRSRAAHRFRMTETGTRRTGIPPNRLSNDRPTLRMIRTLELRTELGTGHLSRPMRRVVVPHTRVPRKPRPTEPASNTRPTMRSPHPTTVPIRNRPSRRGPTPTAARRRNRPQRRRSRPRTARVSTPRRTHTSPATTTAG